MAKWVQKLNGCTNWIWSRFAWLWHLIFYYSRRGLSGCSWIMQPPQDSSRIPLQMDKCTQHDWSSIWWRTTRYIWRWSLVYIGAMMANNAWWHAVSWRFCYLGAWYLPHVPLDNVEHDHVADDWGDPSIPSWNNVPTCFVHDDAPQDQNPYQVEFFLGSSSTYLVN